MSRSRTKIIVYRGNLYECTTKKGNVIVRQQRTARGQNLIVGAYDMTEKTWQNESQNGPLPDFIKNEVENYFIK